MDQTNVHPNFTEFIRQKKIVFAVLFVLITLVLGSTLFLLPRTSQIVKKEKFSPKPTTSQNVSSKLELASVFPQDKTTNSSIIEPISIAFASPLNETQRNQVAFSLSPKVPGKPIWSQDAKILIFTPSVPLATDTDYTAIVTYGGTTYSWTFKTVSIDNVSTKDQQKIQQMGDMGFAQKQKAIHASYPWIDNLPLQTSAYYVYFDVDKKSFVGMLYPKTSGGTSLNNQVAGMKNEIYTELNKLGINSSNYPFEWTVTPQP